MPYILATRFLIVFAAAALAAQPQEATPAAAALNVSGDISSPLNLKAADLASMPRASVTVQEHDGTKIVYEGVSLVEILKEAGAPLDKQLRGKAMASYILAKAHDGYEVVFSLAEIAPEFGNTMVLVADQRGGKPMGNDPGPLRLVCPNDKAGARSLRMLETIEIVRLRK
jgi:DMSO/TMAO reductase YedYZ molybdopterin-dependent catalytic subunit